MPVSSEDSKNICTRLTALETQNKEFKTSLSEIDHSTKEIVQFFNAFKGAFSVLELMASLARPLGFIAMAIAALLSVIAIIRESFYR